MLKYTHRSNSRPHRQQISLAEIPGTGRQGPLPPPRPMPSAPTLVPRGKKGNRAGSSELPPERQTTILLVQGRQVVRTQDSPLRKYRCRLSGYVRIGPCRPE
ncbi:unnamed protein product [Diplocarpon coronariae]